MSSDADSITLTVVIPAYNEENGIEDIMDRVLAVEPDLKTVGITALELIVVDDGSSDRTSSIVTAHNQVRLIQHETNKGYGAALKTGFSAAKGELLGFLDADGTYPPEFFPQLCVHARDGAEIVVGSRRSGGASEIPLMRKIGNLLWSNLVSILGRQRVIDPASGMRVFHREILERIYPLPDGLNLTPVMSTRAVHEGIILVEVPIPYKERVGRSKLSVVHDGTLFLNSIIWTVLTYNPVRILGLIGLALIALAILVAVGIIIARLSGITTIGPLGIAALYTALVSAVAGISIFSLGVTFNYLVSLFVKRPVRQGLFKRPLFKQPLDRHFGWLGLGSLILGFVLGVVSLVLGASGWEIARLWLYLLGSAMLILIGLQLIIYWILIRALDELSQREIHIQQDLNSNI
ncbi:MAG: glycosyltransferase family 2 protein [Chloroflexota bacterium]|nr:glycosyltransferase family 2 protein [Chloroflexota bacterium]